MKDVRGVRQHIIVSTCTTFRIRVPYLAYEIFAFAVNIHDGEDAFMPTCVEVQKMKIHQCLFIKYGIHTYPSVYAKTIVQKQKSV